VDNTGPNEDIYILDVGAGAAAFGDNIQRILTREYPKLNKKVHIISLTGGFEATEKVTSIGSVTHSIYPRFRIENIEKELLARGHSLKGKVQLIVSRWTMIHLVDPMGTIKQLLRLLKPSDGMLLGTHFGMYVNGQIDLNDQTARSGYRTEKSAYDLSRALNVAGIPNYVKPGPLFEFVIFGPEKGWKVIPLVYDRENVLKKLGHRGSASRYAVNFNSSKIEEKDEPKKFDPDYDYVGNEVGAGLFYGLVSAGLDFRFLDNRLDYKYSKPRWTWHKDQNESLPALQTIQWIPLDANGNELKSSEASKVEVAQEIPQDDDYKYNILITSYHEAKRVCETYHNGRLPTLKELKALYFARKLRAPDSSSGSYPYVENSWYWFEPTEGAYGWENLFSFELGASFGETPFETANVICVSK